MWHASISITDPLGRPVRSATQAERLAVRLLADVGNDREWWVWNSRAGVGHLRVGLTPAEASAMPTDPVIADAGPSGPERPRSRPTGARRA